MNQERLLKIILSPHISEKGTILSEKYNQYVFKVLHSANKQEVKNAIELVFNTKVESVRIVNTKSKVKLFKGIKGKRKAWKKAYVSLEPNEKLDLTGTK